MGGAGPNIGTALARRFSQASRFRDPFIDGRKLLLWSDFAATFRFSMKAAVLTSFLAPSDGSAGSGEAAAGGLSLEALFVANADFVFRTCRRLGLDEASAEDATQQVFIVAAKKLDQIPAGKERAFLLVTARNIAGNARRTTIRRREEYTEVEQVDPSSNPERLVESARARAVLDRILDDMDIDLRTVFVLFELEQLTCTEIAEVLEVPRGTVASRARRARETFEASLRRRRKHQTGGAV